MQTYPLKSLNIEEAVQLQFKIIDCITREFRGSEILNRGDLGVIQGLNKPVTTWKAEKVIAQIFDTEACMLIRGAGSGAIRQGLHTLFQCGDTILVHKAPIYSTTKTSFEMLGLIPINADFNDDEEIKEVLHSVQNVKGVLVQHTRQKLDDKYDMRHIIETIKSIKDIPVLTDDNYAAMKVSAIGVQCGADLSCFSAFKLLGPEGIGVIVGKKNPVEKLVSENYSGGMQVQGHEALDVLRGLVYAPVALAIQARTNEECVRRLKNGEIPQIKDAFLANAQSKVLLVEFYEDIAEKVLKNAEEIGAAPNPVGAESKYELVPMFYRISGTFRNTDASLEKRMIRINPMRAGADTILRILREAVNKVK